MVVIFEELLCWGLQTFHTKDMGVECCFPMKRMTRKIQASVKNMKSARQMFRIQDLCCLDCQYYNHSNLQPRERSSVTVMQVYLCVF